MNDCLLIYSRQLGADRLASPVRPKRSVALPRTQLTMSDRFGAGNSRRRPSTMCHMRTVRGQSLKVWCQQYSDHWRVECISDIVTASIASEIVMKLQSYLPAILSMLACSACFDPTFSWRVNEQFKEQGLIVISPYSGGNRLNGKSGFYISLRPSDAEKLQAPSGVEFLKLLDMRILFEERTKGHKLCESGYQIIDGHTVNYHGMYVGYDAECK